MNEYFVDDDVPFTVRYEYMKAEQSRFNPVTGIGHQGCDEELKITEVNFGDRWEPVERFPQLNINWLHDKIMQQIIDAEEAAAAARAEREHEYD